MKVICTSRPSSGAAARRLNSERVDRCKCYVDNDSVKMLFGTVKKWSRRLQCDFHIDVYNHMVKPHARSKHTTCFQMLSSHE